MELCLPQDIWYEIARQVFAAAIEDMSRTTIDKKDSMLDSYNNLYMRLKSVLRGWILPFKGICKMSRNALIRFLFTCFQEYSSLYWNFNVRRNLHDNKRQEYIILDIFALSGLGEIKLSQFIGTYTFYIGFSKRVKNLPYLTRLLSIPENEAYLQIIEISTCVYNTNNDYNLICVTDPATDTIEFALLPSKVTKEITSRSVFNCKEFEILKF